MPVALFIFASAEGYSVIFFVDLWAERQEDKRFIRHAALLCDSQPLYAFVSLILSGLFMLRVLWGSDSPCTRTILNMMGSRA